MFFFSSLLLTSKIILTNHKLELPLVECKEENKDHLVDLLNNSNVRSAEVKLGDKIVTLRRNGVFAENRSDFKFYSKNNCHYGSSPHSCKLCKQLLEYLGKLLNAEGMICNVPFGDVIEIKNENN